MESESFKLNLANKELKVEIKNLAEQANGSVLVQYGQTMVLATAVMSQKEREGLDFFPLTVDYEERYYAAGKIKGPRYIKRESRPSDEAILNSRLIDRTIRPLFKKELKRDVQVIITCLSWDTENDPDVAGLLSASLALLISDIPWSGPIAPLRIGKIGSDFVFNPSYGEREKSDFDLVLTAKEGKKGDILINMLEGGFQETEEKEILKAVDSSLSYFKKIIEFQKEIQNKVGKEKLKLESLERDTELEKEIRKLFEKKLETALYQGKKSARMEEVGWLKEELRNFIEENYPASSAGGGRTRYGLNFFEEEIDRLVHQNILEKEKRPDSRELGQLREISCDVGILPRTHGSGLFCRGQTKSLSILTLGAPGDQQILEGMEITGKKRFMHHYNFPPYSVGEIRPMRGPGRREIGHGMLAERALLPLIPSFEEFPYTIRIVSEILSSNGSTSMASASSSSLALMDAGVPIKRPVTGISIGLIADESGRYKVLADIQGPEDHYGDMDFKVAGTKEGVTALQMDVKIEGITQEILKEALELGKKCRLQILEKMEKVLAEPRPELSPFAPRIYTLQIKPEKIREVIGPGGKVINEIIEECGVSIDIEDSGRIFVTGEKEEAAKKALSWIQNITREIKVGEVFQGKIKRIVDFGIFVEILPGQDGLIHISKLNLGRFEKIDRVFKIGQILPVKVSNIDEQGRINLLLEK